jgi:hypothetical protein
MMTTPNGRTCRYRIVLRGECRTLLNGILGDAQIEAAHGQTCVTASVRDESEFYGLLDRFQDLALHIVHLDELGPAR